MANATDNVYVNIIANTQGFTEKMRSALSPIREFTSIIRNIMALGGASIVINRIVQAIGDMEKAYVKLHPESQKAVGSLTNWNTAMAELKGKQGEVVSKILTPLRIAFLDLVDPINQSVYELRALNNELSLTYSKYLSTATKKTLEMKEAQDALTKATQDNKRAQGDLQDVMKARAALMLNAPTDQLRTLARQRGGEAIAEQVRAYDEQLAKYNARIAELQDILAITSLLMNEIPAWIKEHGEAVKAAEPALVKYNSVNTETFDIMQDYTTQLEAAAEAMAALHTGTKAATEDTLKLGRAMVGITDSGKGGSRGLTTKSIGRKNRGTGEAAEDVADLTAEWQKYADLIVSISSALGEAFVTGDYIEALRQMTTALLDFIAKEAIAAGLKMILAGNIAFGIALLGIGGITLGVSAGIRASGGGGGGGEGVELPRMAGGGVVTRPTIAMIGEAGPEAVVPLGRGVGGTTIIVQGSVWQTEDLARAVADRMGKW